MEVLIFSICDSLNVAASSDEPGDEPRIMLVKPSSRANARLASVYGPRMPSLGFHISPRFAAMAAPAVRVLSSVRLEKGDELSGTEFIVIRRKVLRERPPRPGPARVQQVPWRTRGPVPEQVKSRQNSFVTTRTIEAYSLEEENLNCPHTRF